MTYFALPVTGTGAKALDVDALFSELRRLIQKDQFRPDLVQNPLPRTSKLSGSIPTYLIWWNPARSLTAMWRAD